MKFAMIDLYGWNVMREKKWFEELPESCPPEDAVICEGTFYRIAAGDPVKSLDFFSQRRLNPDKIFVGVGIDECIVRSVSLFNDLDETQKRLRLPKFRNSTIVEIVLSEEDGMIKKTFGVAHYSWWRSHCFNVNKAKVITL